MRTEKTINHKIDWHSIDNAQARDAEIHNKILSERIHYFNMLRRFLQDIKNLGRDEIDDVFAKYNVHLVDIDDIPRVNLDEPTNKE